MGRICLLLSALLFSFCMVHAQDVHFTQFFNSAVSLNPALTGDIEGNIRVAGNYRNQWFTIENPFVTSSVCVDAKFFEDRLGGDAVGGGFMILNDKSGIAGLNQLQVMLSGSFRKFIGSKRSHVVSAGLQAGFFQKKVDVNKLTFGSQYLNGNFDNTISSGENFSDLSVTKPDVQAGLSYSYLGFKGMVLSGGASAYHLTMPNESMTGGERKLSMRYVFHADPRIKIKDDIYFSPKLLQMYQNEASESSFMAVIDKLIRSGEKETIMLSIGTGVRLSDAYLFYGGVGYKNWQLGISYDINSSELSAATNGQGGIELSLIYRDFIIPGKSNIPKLAPASPS